MQVGTLGKPVPGVLREVPYAAVVAGAASAFGLKIGFIELVTEAESMATAPTIARNLFVAVTDTHAEGGGRGGTCEASSVRMTSHARAVAPMPLSPLGGVYGHRLARAA